MGISSLPADVLLRKQQKLKRELIARVGVSYIEKRKGEASSECVGKTVSYAAS